MNSSEVPLRRQEHLVHRRLGNQDTAVGRVREVSIQIPSLVIRRIGCRASGLVVLVTVQVRMFRPPQSDVGRVGSDVV